MKNNKFSYSEGSNLVDEYIENGWSIVPIPRGTKGPRTPQWNTKEASLRSCNDLQEGFGIGLAHAYSGTMALDIDNWAIAEGLLSCKGISLQALYSASDAVAIKSGKVGHGKLLYAMPSGVTLPSKKITYLGVTAYELRCATSNGLTVQDVLPPSIHPETLQPYQWDGLGDWKTLPKIPMALLDMWKGLLADEKVQNIKTSSMNTSWEDIRKAIECVDADCTREDWIGIGMALHWAGDQTGQLSEAFQLWKDWSSTAQNKYPGEKTLIQQWRSFNVHKSKTSTLGTLFHIAKQHGWKRAEIDTSSLFSQVKTPLLTPDDITMSLRPPAPDIDMRLWPKSLSQRAQEVSDSIGCDELLPLFAGLAAVCGVVDARIRLELMPGFRVPPVLWLMTIGAPGDRKSPGSKPMLAPLKNIELEDRPRYKKELLEWEGKEAGYASAKKAFLEFAASPEALLGGQAPHVPDLPSPPASLKITVSDVTSQKLVRLAADRPRGLLCHLDEMNSWINKLTNKVSGEDRSAWVVSYESDRYEMDRVGAGSIHAENLAVSIYCNVQPKVFRDNLENLTSDGLLQRFIPAILRQSRSRLGHPIPEYLTSEAAWENTLRTVYSLQEQTYKLSQEAFTEYRRFQVWYEQAKKDERLVMSSDTLMTAFGKLEGTAGRLILLFHIIENPFSEKVSVDIVERVVSIIKTYVLPAYRYAFEGTGGVSSFDQWVKDHIIHYFDQGKITLSNIRRSARRQLEGKNIWTAEQMILGAMDGLEKAGWVIRLDDGLKEHVHHAEWAINPVLGEEFKDYRKESIAAKQRIKDQIYSLSTKPVKSVYGYDPDQM